MRSEFGVTSPTGGGSQSSFDDVSDCTSVASWGRRLLNESSGKAPLVISPIDSLSTRALPPCAEADSPRSPAPTQPPPPLPLSRPRGCPLPPPLPPRRSPPLAHEGPPEPAKPAPAAELPSIEESPKKGHAKSKSLDRGMALSNVKPPSASAKSSSLNRGVSSKIVSSLCEEEQRINNAQGVIHQLTLSVLSSSGESVTEDPSHLVCSVFFLL